MSSVKNYKIIWLAHEDQPELHVEIDHAICTDDFLHGMNGFFCGEKERLSDSNGDVTAAVLKLLATTCFSEQAGPGGGWNTKGIISLFNDGEFEGYPPMDGSKGIKILRCDVPGIYYGDCEVTEL